MTKTDLDLTVSTTIKAESLEHALQLARTMSASDFVSIDGDYIDGSVKITGVYE